MPDQAAGNRYFITDQVVLLILINVDADVRTLRLKLSKRSKFAFTQIYTQKSVFCTSVHSEYCACILYLLNLLLLPPVDFNVD